MLVVNSNEIPFNTYQTGKIKREVLLSLGKNMGQWKHHSLLVGELTGRASLQKQFNPIQVKLKYVFRTPGRIPTHDHHETCTKMFIVAYS